MVLTGFLSGTDVYYDGPWYVRLTTTILLESQSYWFRINTDVFNIDCDGN